MERLPLKRHYQITLVNVLTRITTLLTGIDPLRIFRDAKRLCTLPGESSDQNAREETLGYYCKHRSNKNSFREKRPFPL